ncbi:GAF domain-containing protein [Streptomyces sp. XD-27]|uniref:GAF domain-containing protein n=1 Tax=Streptomyces sp. XD-27 TaxID=3062779 RepID=UPI00350E3B79
MNPTHTDRVIPLAAHTRPVIAESWSRSLDHGIDPDGGRSARPLSADRVAHRRHGSPLAELMPHLREGLRPLTDDERHVMVVTDVQGCVLWQEGSRAVRRSAERLDLAEGAFWAEESTGTNGIGTSLVTRRPLQVLADEHFVHALRTLACAAAPLHDPRDGRLLGVVNVTGPAGIAHPSTLALVAAVARVAEGELRARHWASIERLRTVAAPVLARLAGTALAVDAAGWPVAVTGMAPPSGWRCRRTRRPGRSGCRRWARARWSRCPAAGWCGSAGRSRRRRRAGWCWTCGGGGRGR